MHCPECNTNNKQRIEMKDRFCGCCAGSKNISFNRFVQWQLGWVCWLDGGSEASVSEMNRRCISIIHECYKKVDKKINRTFETCTFDDADPSAVTQFYASQFMGSDCKIKSNY